MKKVWVLAVLIYLGSAGLMAQVSVNTTGASPAANAILDVSAANMGILIPRVQLTGKTDVATIPSPQQGLIVFNTGNAGLGSNAVMEGLYYWSTATGGNWVSINSSYNSFMSSDDARLNFEDFIFDRYEGASSNDNQYSLTQAEVGSGISDIEGNNGSIPYVGGTDYMGRHVFFTGTSSVGKAGLFSYDFLNRAKIGGPYPAIFEVRVRIETPSDATNTFTAYFGLMDLAAASGTIPNISTVQNGIFFTYTSASPNLGTWMALTKKTGSSTTGASAALNGTNWMTLKAVIQPNGASVDFYVDNAYAGSSSTNIPINTAMKFGFGIEKSKGTLARTASIDYFYWRLNR